MTDRRETVPADERARELAHNECQSKCRGWKLQGYKSDHCPDCNALTADIQSYADARAAEEREACAKVAEGIYPRGSAHTYASENADVYHAQEITCGLVATAIRARGE